LFAANMSAVGPKIGQIFAAGFMESLIKLYPALARGTDLSTNPAPSAANSTVRCRLREYFLKALRPAILDVLVGGAFWERGWVDPARDRLALEQYFAGQGDNSFFIWQWVNLELWARHFIDQKPDVRRTRG